ncbi:hypothetical protein D3C81_1862370 [compost metagenome]
MVAPQVIPHLDPVHPSSATDQGKGPRTVGQGAHHFKGLDIEALEELLDPRFVRMDVLGTLLLLGQVDLDRRLEGATQRRSTVGEGLIGLEFRQGLDGALGTGTNLVHVALQVAEIATDAAAGEAG